MRLADLAARLLQLSKVMHTWLELLTGMESSRRHRVADYADETAATLGRAAQALALSKSEPDNLAAAHQGVRELGRIAGYIEDIILLLHDQLDGRKLAGVKRRLDGLATIGSPARQGHKCAADPVERLLEAEGYFRALADRLRV